MGVMRWPECWAMGMPLFLGTLRALRPAYYYKDDEVVVVASERPAIQTVFNVPYEEVKELDSWQCHHH